MHSGILGYRESLKLETEPGRNRVIGALPVPPRPVLVRARSRARAIPIKDDNAEDCRCKTLHSATSNVIRLIRSCYRSRAAPLSGLCLRDGGVSNEALQHGIAPFRVNRFNSLLLPSLKEKKICKRTIFQNAVQRRGNLSTINRNRVIPMEAINLIFQM